MCYPSPRTKLLPIIPDRTDNLGLTGDPGAGRVLPGIEDPLAQLGMRLFFSSSLGGTFEAACVSCHHPALGGADSLSLPVGVDAVDASLLGLGRSHVSDAPNVPRNAPTTFNIALYDRVLFHDGRIESLAPQPGANGAVGAIRTPDSAFGQGDPDSGETLPAAQSRFPVTSVAEMRDTLLPGAGNEAVRDRLAARIGGYGDGAGELAPNGWLPLFQQAFNVSGSAESLVTFGNITAAIAAYERSQRFVDTPWRDYLSGNLAAISAQAKRGATLFLRPANQGNQNGGAGCSGCHRGDFFTDENFHTVAFPQIGPGKGDGVNGDDDFGRARETGNAPDRYAFRTPSLLNVALTAPYGHAGAYATLPDVVRHYRNPRGAVDAFFNGGGWCRLPQFLALPAGECAALYPNARLNSIAALDKLQADRAAGRSQLPNIQLNDGQVADIVAFLQTLTDRCAADRGCLARWLPPRDGGPDGRQLEAVNETGDPL